MKDDEYKGYYCLLIAILCDLNAAEASIGSISVFSIYGQAQSKKINRKEGNE